MVLLAAGFLLAAGAGHPALLLFHRLTNSPAILDLEAHLIAAWVMLAAAA